MTTRRFDALRLATVVALAAATSVGCIGDIGGGASDEDGPGTGPQSCEDVGIHGAARPLRRLSPEQYENTMRDLLGDEGFTGDLGEGGEIITESEVRALRDGAERAISRSGSWTKPVFPCDIASDAGDVCVDDFLSGFVTRAFRRPVTEAERASLKAVYANARGAGMTFQESMEMLFQVVLQDPAFVYLFEAGEGDASETTRKLKSYEVASRLSYLLWNTMPDDALFASAESGEIDEADGLATQAARLLDDPRAERAVQRFVSHWLQLDGGVLHHALEEADKDAALYPEFDPALRAAMRAETEALVRRVFFEDNGSLADLLTSNRAYVNGPLAALYGVSGPTDESTWQWVELDPAQRAGLLTRAAFLTVLSTAKVTAPIRRGVWVVEEMLCSELGEPPANANNVKVEGGVVDGKQLTVREEVTLRTTTDPQCASCHNIINPVGFTFETYDAIGKWQTEEVTTGLPIDSSGTIATTGDVDGPVVGAVELSQRLSSSEKVRACFADRWYREAIGEALGALDTCSLETIQTQFAEGGSMRDLVLAIIASDAFRYINVSEVGQ
jgi:hypothetical protein